MPPRQRGQQPVTATSYGIVQAQLEPRKEREGHQRRPERAEAYQPREQRHRASGGGEKHRQPQREPYVRVNPEK